MHLVINATELGRRRGGNETFIAGLVEGLSAINPAMDISLLTCDWGVPVQRPFPTINLGRYRPLPFLLWQQTRILRQVKVDWYLSNFFLPVILPCRGAVMVHDVSFKSHPEYFPRSIAWYMSLLTGRAIRQADVIFTPSDFSRQETLRHYSTEPDKIITVHNGIGREFFEPAGSEAEARRDEEVLNQYGVGRPYILALGNIHPRKNLGRLLAAYTRLKQQRPTAPTMVWAGLQRWDSGSLIEQAAAAGVLLPGYVSQTHLPAFYRQAEMLVYPSLYEGFGLPPVEAMACGTPVITSCTSSLPEVVGGGAVTIDPTDVDAIAGAIETLLDDAALRRQLRVAGPAQARQFSWPQAARKFLDELQAR